MTGEHVVTGPASRLDLLDAARAVQQAAAAGDIDALHDEVCRLKSTLVERAGQAPPDTRSDDLQQRLAKHGQQRLIRFLDDILSTTREGPGSCTCLVRGAELRSLLIRQLRLEASVVRRTPGSTQRPKEDR